MSKYSMNSYLSRSRSVFAKTRYAWWAWACKLSVSTYRLVNWQIVAHGKLSQLLRRGQIRSQRWKAFNSWQSLRIPLRDSNTIDALEHTRALMWARRRTEVNGKKSRGWAQLDTCVATQPSLICRFNWGDTMISSESGCLSASQNNDVF